MKCYTTAEKAALSAAHLPNLAAVLEMKAGKRRMRIR